MNVLFKSSFMKDLKKLPDTLKREVSSICFDIFPKLQNIHDIQAYSIRPLKGFSDYYRIRIDDYRIGFKKIKEGIIFMCVKHRKDIYKYFP